MNIYICRRCGELCDEKGMQLEDKSYSETLDTYINENILCELCSYEEEMKGNAMQVTREMAFDAGDPDLEGTWI